MSERKGLFTKEQEIFFAGLLDDAIKFKNPIMEALDKAAFKLVIQNVDNILLEKIPEDWQNPLEPVLDAALQKKWTEAGELAAKFINEKIDIPGVDEVSEQVLISGIVQLIVGAILAKVETERPSVRVEVKPGRPDKKVRHF